MYYGTLFLRTPFIYNVQCVIAGIWIVGAVWNLAKYAFQYLKFQKVLEKSVSFRLPETEKNKIIQELGEEPVRLVLFGSGGGAGV